MKKKDLYLAVIESNSREIKKLQQEVTSLKKDNKLLQHELSAAKKENKHLIDNAFNDKYKDEESKNKNDYLQRQSYERSIAEIGRACGLSSGDGEKTGGEND